MTPLLLLLLLGIADLGRVFHAFIVVENAAREGARHYATHGVQAQAETRARDEAVNAGIAPRTVSVQAVSATTVRARVSHDFSLVSGFLTTGAGLPGTITITGTADMRILVGG